MQERAFCKMDTSRNPGTPDGPPSRSWVSNDGSVLGPLLCGWGLLLKFKGLLMVVSNGGSSFLGERNSATPFSPQFNLFTSILPLFNLFLPLFNLNLTSASSRISSHGLETTVYRLLGNALISVSFLIRQEASITFKVLSVPL